MEPDRGPSALPLAQRRLMLAGHGSLRGLGGPRPSAEPSDLEKRESFKETDFSEMLRSDKGQRRKSKAQTGPKPPVPTFRRRKKKRRRASTVTTRPPFTAELATAASLGKALERPHSAFGTVLEELVPSRDERLLSALVGRSQPRYRFLRWAHEAENAIARHYVSGLMDAVVRGQVRHAQTETGLRLLEAEASRQPKPPGPRRPRRASQDLEFFAPKEKSLMATLRDIYDPHGKAAAADHELYEPQNLLRREALLWDARVRQALNLVWRATDSNSDGRITFDEYQVMHRKMTLALVPRKAGRRRHARLCRQDWDTDRGGHDFLNYERFTRAWFALADKFTDGIDADEYAGFLEDVFERCTVLDNRTGAVAFRSDREIRGASGGSGDEAEAEAEAAAAAEEEDPWDTTKDWADLIGTQRAAAEAAAAAAREREERARRQEEEARRLQKEARRLETHRRMAAETAELLAKSTHQHHKHTSMEALMGQAQRAHKPPSWRKALDEAPLPTLEDALSTLRPVTPVEKLLSRPGSRSGSPVAAPAVAAPAPVAPAPAPEPEPDSAVDWTTGWRAKTPSGRSPPRTPPAQPATPPAQPAPAPLPMSRRRPRPRRTPTPSMLSASSPTLAPMPDAPSPPALSQSLEPRAEMEMLPALAREELHDESTVRDLGTPMDVAGMSLQSSEMRRLLRKYGQPRELPSRQRVSRMRPRQDNDLVHGVGTLQFGSASASLPELTALDPMVRPRTHKPPPLRPQPHESRKPKEPVHSRPSPFFRYY